MPPRRLPLWIPIAAGALTCRSIVPEEAGVLFEVAIYAGLLAFLCRQPALVETFRGLPPAHGLFLSTFFVLLVAGQLWGEGSDTYPFVDWSMYTRVYRDDPTFFRYVSVTEDGGEQEIPVARAFPTLSARLRVRLDRAAREIEERPSADGSIDRFEAGVRSLAEAYERRNPGSATRAVRVSKCTVPMIDRATPEPPRCRPFRTIALSDGAP